MADNFNNTHPLLKLVPVNWGYIIPFEMIHSSNPTKTVQKFIDVISKKLYK